MPRIAQPAKRPAVARGKNFSNEMPSVIVSTVRARNPIRPFAVQIAIFAELELAISPARYKLTPTKTMSLHAQVSPEVQARLNKQRQRSTITSIIIALLGMALIGVILLIISLTLKTKEVPTIVSYNSGLDDKQEITAKKVQTSTQRNPSAPSSSMTKVIASNSVSPTAVPVPEFNVPEPSTDFGDGDDFGSGWGGDGDGGGAGFNNIPASMKQRCSRQDRLARLAANGGTEACEEAVVKGLQWLKKTQNSDGSWSDKHKIAMTSLALLCYMAHCETAGSPEFGGAVLKGMTYLIDIAKKNKGKMGTDFKSNHWVYEHAIAVYALSECYSLCVNSFGENIPELKKAVIMSGTFLVENQNDSGGWAYLYVTSGGHVDTSVTGWNVQALKALEVTGLGVKGIASSSRKALSYFDDMQNQDGAVGYETANAFAGGRDGTTLTAVGALCYQMWGKGSVSFTRKACKFIDENIKFKWNSPKSDIYGQYYAAQAMLNYGGDYWKRYNAKFRDEVLNNQNGDGSWKDVGGGNKVDGTGVMFQGGGKFQTHYRSCLAILMLETYYRFLPGSH